MSTPEVLGQPSGSRFLLAQNFLAHVTGLGVLRHLGHGHHHTVRGHLVVLEGIAGHRHVDHLVAGRPGTQALHHCTHPACHLLAPGSAAAATVDALAQHSRLLPGLLMMGLQPGLEHGVTAQAVARRLEQQLCLLLHGMGISQPVHQVLGGIGHGQVHGCRRRRCVRRTAVRSEAVEGGTRVLLAGR